MTVRDVTAVYFTGVITAGLFINTATGVIQVIERLYEHGLDAKTFLPVEDRLRIYK